MTDKQLAKLIASRIQRAREHLKWSQSELSRQSKVTAAAISQLEKGSRLPTGTVLNKLSQALKISPSEFLTDENTDIAIKVEQRALLRDFGDILKLDESDTYFVKELIRRLIDKKNKSVRQNG